MITRDSKNILVVKDSVFFRTRLSSILTEAGHRVRLIEDGSGTINAIESGAKGIDLLIIDILLPDMDGFAVLRWLRDHGHGERFPVFVVTGANEPNLIVSNLFKYGAAGVIAKDFTPERIIFHMNRALFPEKSAALNQSVRIPVSLPVDFSVGEEPFDDSGLLLNISKSGAFLHTVASMSPGASIDLRFSLPGAPAALGAKGFVVWKTDSVAGKPLFGGYGIKFTSVPPPDRAALESFVDAEYGKLFHPG